MRVPVTTISLTSVWSWASAGVATTAASKAATANSFMIDPPYGRAWHGGRQASPWVVRRLQSRQPFGDLNRSGRVLRTTHVLVTGPGEIGGDLGRAFAAHHLSDDRPDVTVVLVVRPPIVHSDGVPIAPED